MRYLLGWLFILSLYMGFGEAIIDEVILHVDTYRVALATHDVRMRR